MPARSDTRPSGTQQRPPASSNPKHSPKHEVVDPRWLLRAALGAILVAAVCAYITVCVAFWKTQWQLVLHPTRTLAASPVTISLPYENVHFGAGPNGQPQMEGWWVPSENVTAPVALMLHGGSGSMSDSLPFAATLHRAGLHVFLFDYRGFGPSAGAHPTQASMEQDADTALQYVENTRHVPPVRILPVGEGLGASLAVQLAGQRPHLPAIILLSADGDVSERARTRTRSQLVPFTLLFRERFPLAEPLRELRTPKLIVSFGTGSASVVAQRAADPKMTVELPAKDEEAFTASLRRFLDTYVPLTPQSLTP